MYSSKPKDKDGDPIELVVPEAIEETSSPDRSGIHPLRAAVEQRPGFYGAVSVAVVEAMALLGFLIWC